MLALLLAAVAPDFSAVDSAVAASLERGDCPGAVVVVVHDDAVVLRKAYGLRSAEPLKSPLAADGIFDLASLTKPIATGSAIWALIERGKLKPEDRVAKHWPAFAANGKGDVTVAQLLLHTSGLTPDNALADYRGTREESFEKIAGLKLEAAPGTRFKYSDVGFLVLGYLVERLAEKPLERFANETVFAPLKMTDTTFRPGEPLRKRIAPTGKRDGAIILGEVHDPRAHRLGGVAGHAGLFSTADDLARYARMLMNGGELDGVRIFKPETVKRFVEAHEVPEKQSRSYGWDVDTGFAGQRGTLFPKGGGYGHTGFTGTSIWIDSKSRTAVILLTSRVHPADKGNVARLRREVADAVAKAVLK